MYSTQSGNGLPLRAARPRQRPKVLVRQQQNPAHGGRRHPHPAQVGAAVGELAMRAVDLAPLVEQRQDLGDLLVEQPVHRRPARRRSASCPAARRASQRCARTSRRSSSWQARRSDQPRLDRVVEQLEQRGLGGRVDPARDPATQPQPPFPSTSISLTAISLSASDSRATSALAASSSKSRSRARPRAGTPPAPPTRRLWRRCGSA